MATCGPAARQAAESKQGQGSPWRTPLRRCFLWILGLPKYFPVFEPGVEDFCLGKREEANKTKQKPGKGRPTEFHATQAAE